MIYKIKPSNATIKNDNSVYSSGGIALNAIVALNAMVELGGRDKKVASKPESAMIWSINPTNAFTFLQKPNSALVLGVTPINGGVLKGYNYTLPTPVGVMTGQPMGLLLCLTYP